MGADTWLTTVNIQFQEMSDQPPAGEEEGS